MIFGFLKKSHRRQSIFQKIESYGPVVTEISEMIFSLFFDVERSKSVTRTRVEILGIETSQKRQLYKHLFSKRI